MGERGSEDGIGRKIKQYLNERGWYDGEWQKRHE